MLVHEKITLILIYNPFTMKKNRLLILLLLTIPLAVAAQSDVNQMLRGTVNDAKYLAEGYATPLMKSIGYGMNAGW